MSCDRSEAKKVNTDITNSSRIERTLLSEFLDHISGNWDYGVTKEVEFFKDIFTPVKLVSFTDPNLKAILNEYKDGKPISLDLE
ncbi:hypothetical protein TVAG_248470 [Trichomonas vaginalis G3]|uniref:Uncharacterized protein n=1 Tax=Trichomonas vaginalis (strain ATCC PRA-98 / G3) TaxID=412133 RepID=A2E783_TRIV3|nr:hypothetical protein TVAGG3_0283810 [Trichomonas vaginalis G3]EAY11480.1 hypothetical protein TVAG_248470 [Trichomonas vaginalis G3]KAI5526758.1 hypothetical protein TVAGG3_0283810 [Trichomonas vaginalis G3]|eukprot:XP_001323703.1 hypothetical protein [Trichomonas vaginalis G3]